MGTGIHAGSAKQEPKEDSQMTSSEKTPLGGHLKISVICVHPCFVRSRAEMPTKYEFIPDFLCRRANMQQMDEHVL